MSNNFNIPISKQRLFLIFVIAVFNLLFLASYHFYLVRVWEHWGYNWYERSAEVYLFMFAICLIPGIWLPVRIDRPSALIVWPIYLTVYIPSFWLLILSNEYVTFEIVLLSIVLFFSFFLISGFTRLKRMQILRVRIHTTFFLIILLFVGILLFAYSYYVYYDYLKLVSFKDVYIQRLAVRQVALPYGVVYAVSWLSHVINPFLIVYGLHKRNPWFLILGVVGQIYIYSIASSKYVILSVPMVILTYYILKYKQNMFGIISVSGASILVLMGIIFSFFDNISTKIFSMIVLMRTFSIQGMHTVLFERFFQEHPYTYWSHLKMINKFVEYPYDLSLHYLIGEQFFNNPEQSANAHFWATDGIAAYGLLGVMLVSILFGTILYLLDIVSYKKKIIVITPWLVPTAMLVCNVGFGTALFTYGFALAIMMIYIMPLKI